MRTSIKSILKNYLLRNHPAWLAAYAFYLKPSLRASWCEPFNGQQGRQALFRELISKIQFQMIVETGTFHGTTTEFMAKEAGLLVCTVEAEPLHYHYARLRLRGKKFIRLELGDSREFITNLAHDPLLPKHGVFCYLDAHWRPDLPLRQEVELVTRHWSGVVIMIDDFRVPGDEGYYYDDYGPGKKLCLEYLEPLSQWGLTAFFPTLPSSQETGGKRGCVILADEGLAARLKGIQTLRMAQMSGSGRPRL
ncbi:MAG TPA: hypothetical protein VF398_03020 [bacterium]|jgi:hypothetical protein